VPNPEPATFAPRGGALWRDPFPMYKALRDHDPVHHVPDNGEGEDYWVLSRFGHVIGAAVDVATFSSAQGLTFSYGEMERLGVEAPIVMMDPPEHTSLRKLLIKKLTPRQILEIEPEVRAFVVERVEGLRERGEGDVVAELLRPLASWVVAHFLGVPFADREVFSRWTDAIVSASAGGQVLDAKEAVGEMFVYFAGLIEKRRSDAKDDMLSAMVHGTLNTGEPVSPAKILGVGFTMVTGGNDTIMGMIGGGLELLDEHPDQRAILLADPGRIPNAVEEFLRLTAPVQNLARTTTRDVSLEGKTIPKGRKVLLLYASANRDEREFGPDAEACDVTRSIRRHLSFSYGPHHCIGAAAARLQGRIALEEILARCPGFAVDSPAARFAPGPFVRRREYLPFRAEGAA
jgi:cytochrome P450